MSPAPHPQLQRIRRTLSSTGLIRLVSEIDDNGVIPSRALTRTLSDLSTTQIRQAVEQADTLGLLGRSSTDLGLTPAGRTLADLYDATARWARQHNLPGPVSTFTERIRSVFALLAEPGETHPRPPSSDATGARQIGQLLAEWVGTHQVHGLHHHMYGVAA